MLPDHVGGSHHAYGKYTVLFARNDPLGHIKEALQLTELSEGKFGCGSWNCLGGRGRHFLSAGDPLLFRVCSLLSQRGEVIDLELETARCPLFLATYLTRRIPLV